MANYETSPKADAHADGTIWAAALWDLRTQLSLTQPDGVRRADLLVVQALLLLGQLVNQNSGITVSGIRRLRKRFEIGAAAILQANELLHSGQHRELIRASFSRRGIESEDVCGWPLAKTSEAHLGGHVVSLSNTD
jgi:hypothetical protein